MADTRLVWLLLVLAGCCVVWQTTGLPVASSRWVRSAQDSPSSSDRIPHNDLPNVGQDLTIGGVEDVNAASQAEQGGLIQSEEDQDLTHLHGNKDSDNDLAIHSDVSVDQGVEHVADRDSLTSMSSEEEPLNPDPRLPTGQGHTQQGHGGVVETDSQERDLDIEGHHGTGSQGHSDQLQLEHTGARRDLDHMEKHNSTHVSHFLLTGSESHDNRGHPENSSAQFVAGNAGFLFNGHHGNEQASGHADSSADHTQDHGIGNQATSPGRADREHGDNEVTLPTVTGVVDSLHEGSGVNIGEHSDPNHSEHSDPNHSEHAGRDREGDVVHGSGDQSQGPEHVAGGQLSPEGGYVIHEGSGAQQPGEGHGGIPIDKDDGSRSHHSGNDQSQRSPTSRLVNSTTRVIQTEPVTPKLAILPTPAQVYTGTTMTTTQHSIIEGQSEGHGNNPDESRGHSGDGPIVSNPERSGETHVTSGEGQIGPDNRNHESPGHEWIHEGSGTDTELHGHVDEKGKDKNKGRTTDSPHELVPSIVPLQSSFSPKITLYPSSSQVFKETERSAEIFTGAASTQVLSSFGYVTTSYLSELFLSTESLENWEATLLFEPEQQSSMLDVVSGNPKETSSPENLLSPTVSERMSSSAVTISRALAYETTLPIVESSVVTKGVASKEIEPPTPIVLSSHLSSTGFSSSGTMFSSEGVSPSRSTVTSTSTLVAFSSVFTTTYLPTTSETTTTTTVTERPTSTSRPTVRTTNSAPSTPKEVTSTNTSRVVTPGRTTSLISRGLTSTTTSVPTSTSPATVKVSLLTFPVTRNQTVSRTTTTTLVTPRVTTKKHATQKATEKPEERPGTTTPVGQVPGTSSTTENTVHRPGTTPQTTQRPDSTLRPQTSRPSTATVKPQSPPQTTPPPLFIQIEIRMSWQEFCSMKTNFIASLQEIIRVEKQVIIRDEQIRIPNLPKQYCSMANAITVIEETVSNILVQMYLVDEAGKVDTQLTIDAFYVIGKGFQDTVFKDKIVGVRVIQERTSSDGSDADNKSRAQQRESGVTMVIVIASVGGLCCLMLIMLQVVLIHRRVKAKAKLRAAVKKSPRGDDQVALGAIPKSRPNSGYWNPALEDDDDMSLLDLENSHVLNYAALANFCMDKNAIYDEFQNVPCENPGLTKLYVGEDDKNRFANVLPQSHSRVKLKLRPEDTSDYINASYIKGYHGTSDSYIATQSPMVSTVEDFWRMVWEQRSRTIIMLNPTLALGKYKQSTCYWPDSETSDSLREYGDYTVALKKRDEQKDYIECVLEITDIEHNLKREVHHFLLTCWPDGGLPEPLSIVKFVLDTRPHYENSDAPPIVHCGPGTGRTGVLVAVDTCMRQYEARKHVDVVGCVTRMRRDRLGMVQTREQYALIYQALNEYAVILGSPVISTRSSLITLHAML